MTDERIPPQPPEHSGERTDWGEPDAYVLVPAPAEQILLRNGIALARAGNDDLEPVLKLFSPDTAATWLLVSVDPDAPDIAYGLCDLGMGTPELGSVLLSELRAVRGPHKMRVERDLHFRARQTLGRYADEARRSGSIRT